MTAGRCAALIALLSSCHGVDDPEPVFSPADRAALAQLAPATLPAPPTDASNKFADDPRAASLGQKLFFDPLFSGKLLNGDNDGSVFTLGLRGETGRVSCAGCHVPSAGFLDNRSKGDTRAQGPNATQISLASSWGLRRTQSLLDVGQARLLMWDGRRDALYNQPFGPLESPDEMNSARLFVAEQIAQRYSSDYEGIFGLLPPLSDTARFPPLDAAHAGCDRPQPGATLVCHGIPGDGAEYDHLSAADQAAVTRVVVNLGKSLGAYERLLSCGQGRFDRWVHGDRSALTYAEQRGAGIFVGKGRCVSCHSGPFLSDQKFHNVGLVATRVAVSFVDVGDRGAGSGLSLALADPLNVRGVYSDGDDGRLPTVAGPELEGAFRTPMLRCGARRPSFMHTGQMTTLSDVVAFFDRGGDPSGYPGKNELAPLGLTASERADLVSFLNALEGPGPQPALLARP
jgi:cytochrome c peroxidase